MADVIYLLSGGNIGDRKGFLDKAKDLIGLCCGTILQSSAVYETAAWGNEDQQPFYNMALAIETMLPPGLLLKITQEIELQLGRERANKWGERTIDIDILFYGGKTIDTPDLKIPHPLLQERRFVLVPLCEIAADLVHPVFQKTIRVLLDECTDNLAVEPIRQPIFRAIHSSK